MPPNESCANNYSTLSPEPPFSSTRPAPAPSPMVRGRSSTPWGRAHPRCTLSPLLSFLTGKNVLVGSWRRGPAQSRMTKQHNQVNWVAGLWRWNRDWLAISCNLAQDQRMWAGSKCCTCLGGSWFNPTRVKANTSQVKSSWYKSFYKNIQTCLNRWTSSI